MVEVPHEGRGIEEVDGGDAQAGWGGAGQEISLCAAVFRGGSEELAHDLIEMNSGGVDVGEVGIGLVEEQAEIGSGEDDGVYAVALDEGVCDSAEGLELSLVGAARGCKSDIDAVNHFDLDWVGCDDFDIDELTKHLCLDGEAGAEESDAPDASGADGLEGCVDGTDQGDGREQGELGGADLWSDGGNGGDLRSGR